MELKENVQAGLDELDSFESGEMDNNDDIVDEMNDYGI